MYRNIPIKPQINVKLQKKKKKFCEISQSKLTLVLSKKNHKEMTIKPLK
jgi:hypothetical protein